MDLNYNGLWKLLIDKKMNKKELRERIGISSTTLAKMSKGEPVNLKILVAIAKELDADIGDLVCLERNE